MSVTGADLGGLLDLETLYEGIERSMNQSRRARRQSPERAYNIEVLLGVDDSVVQFHGPEHVEKYLLTLMNIVNEIYHDHSLGARINVVLVRIVLVDAKKSSSLIELGNPSQSLENVCRWAFEQQRKDTNDKDYHDHAIFLTRQEFGPTGMQGYAPVTGMCHPVRSCTLNHEDGFSSAFVVAHETGHVLGMEHDGQGNQCGDEVQMGSIMAPLYRPFDPCKQLWCAHPDNPFFCKTKKGPPIDGTICGDRKHCFKGHCVWLTPDIIKRDGNWGMWSEYGACNRPCGRGLQFRTRACDSPRPANGGRTCPGSNYQFRVCNAHECEDPYRDYRAEQCSNMDSKFEYHNKKHHWLPYEHPDPKQRCTLYCQSKETRVVVNMQELVEPGIRCSYKDPYSVCVYGECEKMGCENVVGSPVLEDKCGVCGGDGTRCKTHRFNFTFTDKKGVIKVLEIPRGARHLLIQELNGTSNILAVKNKATEDFFLNSHGDYPETRSVIEKGLEWQYENKNYKDTIQTDGPLKNDVVIMIRMHSSAKAKVSVKYITDFDRSSDRANENNMVPDNAVPYSWVVKKWTPCSKTCGTGTQMTRYGCRKNSEMRLVHRRFCEKIKKPSVIFRDCYLRECAQPIWATGDWGECSKSCGRFGTQTRSVRCVQPLKDGKFKSIRNRYCNDERPEARRDCNRMLCPAEWKLGPWSQCSVSCGKGTQERQVLCHTRDNTIGLCLESKPPALRSCSMDPCPSSQCRTDRSMLCKMAMLQQYCMIPAFQRICCNSCTKANITSDATQTEATLTMTSAVTIGQGFAVKTTTPPSATLRRTSTESVLDAEFNTWEYTILTTGTKIGATTPSVISVCTPSTPAPIAVTTQTKSGNVTLSDIDDVVQNTDIAAVSIATLTADFDDSQIGSDVQPGKGGILIQSSENNELTTSGWNERETVTETSMVLVLTALPPTFEDTSINPDSSFLATSSMTISTTSATMITTETTPATTSSANKEEENNAIEVHFQMPSLDNEFPENNIIPRRGRVFLRERTRNKRIQELLEEKRNFLRRMKRAQGF
ncbi:A disintegrin and metalloproteinase with thrombospondin motifs 2 [Bagarius yarrelli]|uniref:A disintegrin and metalloproteinase with thrombospondin motifs 2 n=1 Tax=Bagarius yarrelli TaxID=175774 RepID=A0A556U8Z2_BAGYA|nr:A disintegrin and metalloproteinase with thrombospondin motifs 2 [Bagarius yarrelli]